jgi:protease PrsW
LIRTLLIQAGLSLLPVLLFLAALELIDTYKLLRFRRVLYTFAAGCASALFCYALNSAAVTFGTPADPWARFGSPPLEEAAKALCVFWLIRAGRIGFMVDAAISGFAVGAGFAVVENLFYLLSNPDLGIGTSAVRGFGTAIMHSGTTAIFAIAAIRRVEFTGSARPAAWAPGLAIAILVHTLYNQFLLPPAVSAAVLLVVLPSVFCLIFWRSERALESWIGTKLDKDMDLLTMIAAGRFTDSHAGTYLRSLEKTFGALILGDMVCYLQLSLELSAQAKGALMRREMGFPEAPDPELPGRLKELAYLEKQIGRAGKLALAPLLGSNHRQVWEIHQLT